MQSFGLSPALVNGKFHALAQDIGDVQLNSRMSQIYMVEEGFVVLVVVLGMAQKCFRI